MTTEKVTISIRLEPDDHRALKIYSVKKSITIQDLARNAILKAIKKDTKWKI